MAPTDQLPSRAEGRDRLGRPPRTGGRGAARAATATTALAPLPRRGAPAAGAGRRTSRHGPIAQLLIASSPLSLILLTYFLGDWIAATIDLDRPATSTNRLGFGLHRTAAAVVDQHVFGAVPTVWLQGHLVDGSAHWWDAVADVVYATHFVAIPVLTGVVWFRQRQRYRAWVTAVLAFIVIGVAGYVVFPAAPPWMASDAGLIGPVTRLSGSGWDHLHLGGVAQLFGAGQAESNPIAAMPSLHAGGAMLVSLFLWPAVRSRWRVVLVLYPVVMGVALVYAGEHYVVDVVAGWLTAAAAVGVSLTVARRSPTTPSRRG